MPWLMDSFRRRSNVTYVSGQLFTEDLVSEAMKLGQVEILNPV